MKIGELSKKQYECKKCGGAIYYAKIEKDNGELYTKDGKPPNGLFGKDSNVLTGQVDALVKDRLHECGKGWIEKMVSELDSREQNKKQQRLDDVKPIKPEIELEGMEEIKSAYRKLFVLADELVTELYPNLDNENVKGQIRSRVMDQIQKERELKLLSKWVEK